MTKLLIEIPFSGFYDSLHSSELDQAEEQIFSTADGSGFISEKLLSYFFHACDYKLARENYAKFYTEAFSDQFEIKSLTFESLVSPREYNFTTDRIHCEIDSEEVKRLFDETSPMTLTTVAHERHTSRDGFMSFYDNNWQTWGDSSTWDHNQLATLLVAWLRDNAEDVNQFNYYDHDSWSQWDEFQLMEYARCNGLYDQWLTIAPKAERLANIASYLRRREERESN